MNPMPTTNPQFFDRVEKYTPNSNFKKKTASQLQWWGWFTYYISIVVQVVAFLFSLVVLIGRSDHSSLESRERLIYHALVLEFAVNVLQLVWYITAPQLVSQAKRSMPSPRFRYVDWFMTTPLMIISLVATSEYVLDTGAHSLTDVFERNGRDIFNALAGNFTMLFIGLAATYATNSLKTWLVWAGFLPLVQVWTTLCWTFAGGSSSPTVWAMYVSTIVLWTLYGVAAHFPDDNQTISYNILDTLAKNVFSIIISVLILH